MSESARRRTDSETVLRLRSSTDWPDDEIAYLAGVASKKVRGLQPQLRSNTQLVVDAASVVNALYAIAPVVHPASKPKLPVEFTDTDSPQRAMLQVQPLQATDGLRCRTAAQAYPIVIDTLRKSQTRPSSDDAHQPLRELVAFKLTLETPSLFTVPTYLRNQEADMDRYAESVLLSESAPSGHQVNLLLDKRLWHSQNPWPSYTRILIAVRPRLANTNSAPLNGSASSRLRQANTRPSMPARKSVGSTASRTQPRPPPKTPPLTSSTTSRASFTSPLKSLLK
jgi:hypothetical protein